MELLLLLACMLLSPGANFSLQLRSPCLSDMVEDVLAAESSYEHWGLLHRLQRVLELMDNAEAAGGECHRGAPGLHGIQPNCFEFHPPLRKRQPTPHSYPPLCAPAALPMHMGACITS